MKFLTERKGRSKAGAFQSGKGWRKTIGQKLADDGTSKPARFWLGMDEQRAAAAALQIEALWLSLNQPHWTPEALQHAEAIRTQTRAADATETILEAPVAVQPQPIAPRCAATVRQAIERYRAAILANPQLAPATKSGEVNRLRALERSPIVGTPLDRMGYEQLAALVNHWLELPPSKKTGQPISQTRALNVLKTARAMFDWLDASGQWEAPRRFDRVFRIKRGHRPGAPTIRTFTVDQLATLYRAAEPRLRLLILLALNCGFASMECATLKRSEVDLARKTIKRARQKTGIVAEWSLWPETVALLRREMAKADPRGLALLTEQGQPLVWYGSGQSRTDSIGQAWTRLARRANVPHLPFKCLRKTGATMIRAIGGIEVSEVYLAHAEQSMARHYSLPDPRRLRLALAALRRKLAPVFAPAKSGKAANAKACKLAA